MWDYCSKTNKKKQMNKQKQGHGPSQHLVRSLSASIFVFVRQTMTVTRVLISPNSVRSDSASTLGSGTSVYTLGCHNFNLKSKQVSVTPIICSSPACVCKKHFKDNWASLALDDWHWIKVCLGLFSFLFTSIDLFWKRVYTWFCWSGHLLDSFTLRPPLSCLSSVNCKITEGWCFYLNSEL